MTGKDWHCTAANVWWPRTVGEGWNEQVPMPTGEQTSDAYPKNRPLL